MVRFMREFVAEVRRRGCITIDDAKEIASKAGIKHISMIQMIYRLKKKGIIVSPKPGVYCRPPDRV